MEQENVIQMEPKKEVPSIRLTPEQIEEIHADEYSLTLFYALRIAPQSLEQIKRQFPEPEAKKAQAVLDRYISSGLIHKNAEGKYYSNYPDNYINYSDYLYDASLETKKDQKVFDLMKEHTGKIDYWRERAYFSIDAFFSREQTNELLEMFKEIRKKAKQFSSDNKGTSVKDLKFRRLKFYDMIFSCLAVLTCTFMFSKTSWADSINARTPLSQLISCSRAVDQMPRVMMVGGNDPTGVSLRAETTAECLFDAVDYRNDGGGHDLGGGDTTGNSSSKQPSGGGGHDPGTTSVGGPIKALRVGFELKAGNSCDWSKYEDLLSYSAVDVCQAISQIPMESECRAELNSSCERIGTRK